MNIFYLDHDVDKCARYHCDKHVVKMILEYSQLLSTAHHVVGNPEPDTIYRKTHENHPSSIWSRVSTENYYWLFNMLCSLHSEYEHRYGKIHASKRLLPFLIQAPSGITSTDFCTPYLCMPDEYKNFDAVKAYRNYYKGEKLHIFAWTKRDKPDWI